MIEKTEKKIAMKSEKTSLIKSESGSVAEYESLTTGISKQKKTRVSNVLTERQKKRGWYRYILRWQILFGISSILFGIMPNVISQMNVSDGVAWIAAIMGMVATIAGTTFFIFETSKIKTRGKTIERRINNELNLDSIRKIEANYGKFNLLDRFVMPAIIINILNLLLGIISNFLLGYNNDVQDRQILLWEKILLVMGPVSQSIAAIVNYATSETISWRAHELRKIFDTLNEIPDEYKNEAVVEKTEKKIAEETATDELLTAGFAQSSP